MRNETKPYRNMMVILLLLLLPLLSSCATVKPVYFNDCDRIYVTANGQQDGKPIRKLCSEDGSQCIQTNFDAVGMSEGQYRKLTTVPENK